jgi:hypothetical protein
MQVIIINTSVGQPDAAAGEGFRMKKPSENASFFILTSGGVPGL